MIYAWIDGVLRQPEEAGERAVCRSCGNQLIAVLPAESIAHWRHKAGDCDRWSETEGEWHLGWKEQFPPQSREVTLRDAATGEFHRADVLCEGRNGNKGVVLELQHSPISERERNAREAFYAQKHRLYWLIHVHSENNFNGYSFGLSLSRDKPVWFQERTFYLMTWMGRSTQFIEKWKRSAAHVFFDLGGSIYYLATSLACAGLIKSLGKGEFALCPLLPQDLISAVRG